MRCRVVFLSAFIAIMLVFPIRAAEPLPKGAKARLGTDRLRNQSSWPAGVLTPDGKHIASTKGFKTVLIDVATGRETGELRGYPSVFSADGKRFASGNGIVTVRDIASGKEWQATKRQFPNFALEPVSLSANGKIIAVGALRNYGDEAKPLTAIVWDVDGEKQLAEVTAEQNQAVGVRISPDGKTLATFGRHNDPKRRFDARNPDGWPEQAVQLWNVADGKLLARVAVSGRTVFGVAFSPDNTLIAISAGDGLINLRDARTGVEKRQLFGQSGLGIKIAFAPDSKTIAAASMSGAVQRWNVADGKLLETLEPPISPQGTSSFRLKELVFTGPDRAVVWGAMGLAAVVWEVPSGKRISPSDGHFHTITSIGFTADGKHILSASYDSAMFRWNAATGAPVGPVFASSHTGGLYFVPVQFLRDANRGISDRGGASVYNLTAGMELFRLPVREHSRVRSSVLGVSGDGTKAVTRLPAGDQEKTDCYEVWDLETPKKLSKMDLAPADPLSVGLSSDSTKLFILTAQGTQDRVLTGYDVGTGKLLKSTTIPGATSAVTVPGKDPLALVPTKAGKFLVIDYATGETVQTLDAGRTDLTGRLVFAPDGKSFAGAFAKPTGNPSEGIEARVYSWPDGQLRHTFAGHSAAISALAFSPDSKTLATGSHDTTVLLWDVTAK